MFNNQRLSSEIHKEWIKLWESCVLAALTSMLELQDSLWRKFYSQRTGVANPMLLTPIQPKMCTCFKSFIFCTPLHWWVCKEKEKNTIFTKCHGELLTTMNDDLFNNALVYTKQPKVNF